jgi:hypothetical protein
MSKGKKNGAIALLLYQKIDGPTLTRFKRHSLNFSSYRDILYSNPFRNEIQFEFLRWRFHTNNNNNNNNGLP